MMAATQKKQLEVEEDPEKLCNFLCGGNVYKDGSDPKLGADQDYPDWLWSLRLDRRPPELSELDPNEWEYWRRWRKLTLRRKNKLRSVQKIKR